MNRSRIISILETLEKEDDFVTSSFLAEKNDSCSKTVFNDLEDIKSIFPSDTAYITKQSKKGIKLTVLDDEDYQKIKGKLIKEEKRLIDSNVKRERLIIHYLFCLQDLRIGTLCRRLNITQAVISKNIKNINNNLHKYDLAITVNKGRLYLKGEEINKRCFLANCFLKTAKNDYVDLLSLLNYRDKDLRKVKELFLEILKYNNYYVSDVAFEYLYYFIIVSLIRNERHLETIISYSRDSIEYSISEELFTRLSNEYDVRFSDNDIAAYSLQLISSQKMYANETKNMLQETNGIVLEMLQEIENSLGINLKSEDDLIMNMNLHVTTLIERIKHNVVLNNSLLSDIKLNYPLSYNAATIASTVLEKKLNKKISDDEIGYLALIINLGLLKKDEMKKRKKVLILCPSGRASSKLLSYQIENRFAKYIESIKISSIVFFDEDIVNTYDCVISTVELPINNKLMIPHIVINNFITEEDYDAIEKVLSGLSKTDINTLLDEKLFFRNIKAEDKDELLKTVVNKIKKKKKIPDDFLKSVMEREHIGNTCFGNGVAIPHPLTPMTNETFISVTIVEKPIKWNDQMASIIFLVSPSTSVNRDLEYFYKKLSKIIVDKNVIKNIRTKSNYEYIKEIFS